MTAPATIAPIGSCPGIKLGAGHVFAAGAAMTALAKNAYVIYKIRLLHAVKVR
jgi:hypothetical protein